MLLVLFFFLFITNFTPVLQNGHKTVAETFKVVLYFLLVLSPFYWRKFRNCDDLGNFHKRYNPGHKNNNLNILVKLISDLKFNVPVNKIHILEYRNQCGKARDRNMWTKYKNKIVAEKAR